MWKESAILAIGQNQNLVKKTYKLSLSYSNHSCISIFMFQHLLLLFYSKILNLTTVNHFLRVHFFNFKGTMTKKELYIYREIKNTVEGYHMALMHGSYNGQLI